MNNQLLAKIEKMLQPVGLDSMGYQRMIADGKSLEEIFLKLKSLNF